MRIRARKRHSATTFLVLCSFAWLGTSSQSLAQTSLSIAEPPSPSYTFLEVIGENSNLVTVPMEPGREEGTWQVSSGIGEEGEYGAVETTFTISTVDVPTEGSIVGTLHSRINCTGGSLTSEANGAVELSLFLEGDPQENPTAWVVVDTYRTIVPGEGVVATVTFGEQVINVNGRPITFRQTQAEERDVDEEHPLITFDGKVEMTGAGKIDVISTVVVTISGCGGPAYHSPESANCETPDPDDDPIDPDPNCPEPNSSEGDALHLNLTTGGFWSRVPILKTHAEGEVEFDFVLLYDQLKGWTQPILPKGWRHSYQIELQGYNTTGSNKVTLVTSDGRRNAFKRMHIGESPADWQPPIGRNMRLIWPMWDDDPVVVMEDGTQYHFEYVGSSFVGRLASIVDLRGRTTTFSYTDGKLTTVTSPYGRTITLTYDDGKLETITGPDSQTTTLAVGGEHDFTIADPLENSIHFDYDESDRIAEEILKNGVTYKAVFSSEGTPTRTLKVVKPGEQSVEETVVSASCTAGFPAFAGDTIAAGMVNCEDGRGNWFNIWRDNLGRQVYQCRSCELGFGCCDTTYYGLGESAGANRNRVIKTTDALGQAREFTWTDFGKMVSRKDDDGNEELFEYGHDFDKTLVTQHTLPGSRTWSYEYNDDGDLLEIIDPLVESGTDKTITFEYTNHSGGKRESVIRTDRNGHKLKLEYNTSGNLVTKTRGFGGGQLNLTETFTHNSRGQVLTRTTVRGADSTVTEYTYDELGRLLETIEDPGEESTLALTTERVYDEHGNLEWVLNPRGYKTTYQYDHRNRLVGTIEDSESGGEQLETSWILDGNGNVVSHTDANSHTTTFEYNDQNFLIQSTDAEGFVTIYDPNPVGSVLRVDRAVVAGAEPDAEDLRSVSFEYDNLNRRTAKIVDPDDLALATLYEYEAGGGCGCNPATPGRSLPHKITDAELKVTYLNYDPLDRLRYVVRKVGDTGTDPLGDNEDDAVTEYIYDPMGNLKHIHGPEGEHTEFEYDQADRRVAKTVHFGEQESFTTHFDYDGADNVDQVTLPNGNAFILTYDKANRLTHAEDTLGDLFAYEYDQNGNVTKRFDGLNATSKTHFWEYVYDRVDRLKEVRDPIIEDTTDLFTSYTYDDAGNRKTMTNPKGIVTHFNYDDLDRLVEVIEDWQESPPGGHATANTTTTYGYDGINQVSIADHDNNTTTYVYDNALRLHEINYPSPGGTVTYEYDDAGNLASRTDQREIETVYGYDDLHHLVSRAYTWGQSNRTETFEFDRSGRLKSAANDNYEATFDYDPAGRLVEAVQSFVTDPVNYTVGYDYVVASNDVHRVVSYPSNSRQVTHTMDERLRLGGVSGGTGVSATWSHDLANRREGVELGNDVTSSFDYDLADRLKNIQHAKDTTKLFDIDYGYDANGNRTYKFFKTVNSTNAMNSRSERYEYDNLDRLKMMERGPMEYYGSEVIMTWLDHPVLAHRQNWDLDRRGNWQEFKRYVGSPLNNPGLTQTREADNVNQYDSIDMDGPSEGEPCTTGCASPLTPGHDAAGNMTLDPSAWDLGSGPEGLEFEYDEENRLTAVKRGSNHNLLMTIAYDALGRRVETVEYWDAASNEAFATPKHVRHVFDGLQTIEEHICDNGVTAGVCDSPGWALARQFVWGDSSRFPEPVAMIDYTGVGLNVSNTCGTGATTQPAEACDSGTPTTGCVYHYLHDALGSVIGLTDCGGNLVERYTYDPYGKTYVEHWDPTATGGAGAWVANGGTLIPDGGGAITPTYSAFGNPFMWTGQRFDAAVSHYHFMFRSYSPTLGRWLQRDPNGYSDGINLYQALRSNSTSLIDVLGFDSVDANEKEKGESKDSEQDEERSEFETGAVVYVTMEDGTVRKLYPQSPEDLANQLEAIEGNIKQIDIVEHSGPGAQGVGEGEEDYLQNDDTWSRIAKRIGPNGVVVCRGCNVAENKEIMQDLADVGDITIVCWSGKSWQIGGILIHWQFWSKLVLKPNKNSDAARKRRAWLRALKEAEEQREKGERERREQEEQRQREQDERERIEEGFRCNGPPRPPTP